MRGGGWSGLRLSRDALRRVGLLGGVLGPAETLRASPRLVPVVAGGTPGRSGLGGTDAAMLRRGAADVLVGGCGCQTRR